jgi:hypothetical protein
MFEMIYKIWCITDAFFAQFIVFNNGEIDDDDVIDEYNGDLDNGDLDNEKTTQT